MEQRVNYPKTPKPQNPKTPTYTIDGFKLINIEMKHWKKIVFTAITVPLGSQTWWAYNWQKDRKKEKEEEIQEKISKLRKPVLDIADIDEIAVTKLSDEAFQEKWQYRPVRIMGIIENSQENLI